jgi:hypothetical protein
MTTRTPSWREIFGLPGAGFSWRGRVNEEGALYDDGRTGYFDGFRCSFSWIDTTTLHCE